jgi:hypothetical protein
MAKTNKYASINFNHFYEKTPSTHPNHTANNNNKPTKNSSSSSSSSSSYSAISSPKTHGRMLVLTRPTPTPRPTTTTTTPPPKSPSPQPQPQRSHQIPGQTPSESGSDHIFSSSVGSYRDQLAGSEFGEGEAGGESGRFITETWKVCATASQAGVCG